VVKVQISQGPHAGTLQKIAKPFGDSGQTVLAVKPSEYLKYFQWDGTKYPMEKSLKVLGAKIASIHKTCEEKLKKLVDEQNDIKNKLQILVKKESKSYLVKDLGEIIYEARIPKQHFVNTFGSAQMTTVLVVLNSKQVKKFEDCYLSVLTEYKQADFENWQKRTRSNVEFQNQNIEDEEIRKETVESEYKALLARHKQTMQFPGAVPESAKSLNLKDDDGNELWRMTAMKDEVALYCRLLGKQGFRTQEFSYNVEEYTNNKNLEAQLNQELRNVKEKISDRSGQNFMDLFTALSHLKIMRTFIDGVLRFGIPPTFVMGIIKPTIQRNDEKVKANLTKAFAEEHLMEMYGQKEEAQDEDFFPYCMSTLTCPVGKLN